MDRSIPSDAELPEGPGASVKPPERALLRPSEEKEKPFPSVLLTAEDMPPEMRLIQPPCKDTMPDGHPTLKESEEAIAAQLEGITERKRKQMQRDLEKPPVERLLEEIREAQKSLGGNHETVATETETGPSSEEGGDTGGVRVEAGHESPERTGAVRKGSNGRSSKRKRAAK